ncbi:uncharacterized protein GGS22DRAFT_188078 [Annulohypoxylon maeteangense]|nr:uncharacterized protein GGS22DRAFT_188078 [Annulohypoxylon maeteangense]KAI0885790.1 hypothetical protein GGS22DRAFT_188078 [Annulohypoxylon maeteangense]
MKNKSENHEVLSRQYLAKVARIHPRNGIETYWQATTIPHPPTRESASDA